MNTKEAFGVVLRIYRKETNTLLSEVIIEHTIKWSS
ncbi:hypothetical protein JOC25_002108 [Solibacillus kalamii]|nr:hypothetical protein [Solibacillus kalamii]